MTEKKIVIEIIGTDCLDTLIKKGKTIPDEEYLKELVKASNWNFVRNKEKIKKFLNDLKKE